MDNDYKKIKVITNKKVYSALEIKKKSKLIYCKKFLKKLTRTNSTNSTNSTISNDSENSHNEIDLIIDKN
jgi:hypothetical protein